MRRGHAACAVSVIVALTWSCQARRETAVDAGDVAMSHEEAETADGSASTPFQVALAKAVAQNPQCARGRVPPQMTYLPQETAGWCWAASAQMAMKFHNTDVLQCAEVIEFCKQNVAACATLPCCDKPPVKECYTGGWPNLALSRNGFEFQERDGPLNPTEIVQELGCEARPFLFSWKDSGGGGHMMVAIDFKTEDGIDWVVAHDPDNREAYAMPYREYVRGSYRHWKDFYLIRKTAA